MQIRGWTVQPGPLIVVIIYMTGTRYACNVSNDWKQICSILYACNDDHKLWGPIFLRSRIRNGLYMLAIYSNRDNKLLLAILYACNVKNRPRVTWLWFLDESRENKFSIIASILGPLRIWDSRYIRSLYWSRLQVYSCPTVEITTIDYCLHIKNLSIDCYKLEQLFLKVFPKEKLGDYSNSNLYDLEKILVRLN